MPLEAIRYTEVGARAHLELLDQRRLPHETHFIEVAGPQEAWQAIKVREKVRKSVPGCCIS